MQTVLNATVVSPASVTAAVAAAAAAVPATAAAAAAVPRPTGEPFAVQQELHRRRFNVTVKPLTTAQLGGDIVINADPHGHLPYVLRVVKSLWQDRCELRVRFHQHSSAPGPLPAAAADFQKILAYTRPASAGVDAASVAVLPVTLIWKRCAQPELLAEAAGFEPIRGEVAIVRYLYRSGPAELQTPEYRVVEWFRTDAVLDAVHELTAGGLSVGQRKRVWAQLAKLLGEADEFYGGELLGAGDVAVASAARQLAYVAGTDAVPAAVVALANRVYELAEHVPGRVAGGVQLAAK